MENLAIVAIILSVLALTISLGTIVYLLAKHFSSHQIQYVPLDGQPTFAPTKEEKESELTVEESGDMEKLVKHLFNPTGENFKDSVF